MREFEIKGVLNIDEAHDGSGCVVRVRWASFDEDEDTWEPLPNVWDDAPQLLGEELRKVGLASKVRSKVTKEYDIAL